MDENDQHDLRMGMGQAAMKMGDAITDDVVIAIFADLMDTTKRCQRVMLQHGIADAAITGTVLGLVAEALNRE